MVAVGVGVHASAVVVAATAASAVLVAWFGHGAVGCGYFFAQRRVDLLGADADALLGGLLADDRLVDHAVKRLHPQGKGAGERRLDLADLRGKEALPAELLLKLVQLNVLIFQL